jgi:hypothetical protein
MTTEDRRESATDELRIATDELARTIDEFAKLLPRQAADALRAMSAKSPEEAGMFLVESIEAFLRTGPRGSPHTVIGRSTSSTIPSCQKDSR